MKTLLLLRHAKSSWKDPELADHDRPLNDRGKRDAPRMGRLIAAEGLEPQVILCSSARRARSTAKRLTRAAGSAPPVQLTEELFHAGPARIGAVIAEHGGDLERVMVIGHNPGLERFVEMLTGQSATLPTAALAVVELPVESWCELALDGAGRLLRLWRPRELPD